MQEILCGVCGRTVFMEESAASTCPSCGAPLPATTPPASAEPAPEATTPAPEAVPAEEIPAIPAYAPSTPEAAAPTKASVAVATEPAPPAPVEAASVAVVPDASAEADVVAEVAHKDTDSENGAAWFAIGIIFLLIAIAVTGWVLWLQYVPL